MTVPDEPKAPGHTPLPAPWPPALPDALLAALGGYGAAMFVYQLTHLRLLGPYLFENSLPSSRRLALAAALILGALLGLVVWRGLARLLAARGSDISDRASRLASGLVGAIALLPLLPVIAQFVTVRDRPLPAAAAILAFAAGSVALIRAIAAARAGAPALPVAGPQIHAGAPPAAGSGSRAGLLATAALAAVYATFMGVLTLARHASFMTNAFDLGTHDQSIFNILASGYQRCTLYGAYAVNRLGDHFSPILYLIAPIHALTGDARTLLVLQGLSLAAGTIPLYLMGRHLTRSALLGVALAASYLLHPALHGVNLDDFHQISLATPLLLAALYFMLRRRDVPFLISIVLAGAVKEEISLTVAAIGAYIFLIQGRRRLGAALVAGAAAYFAAVVFVIMPALGGTPQIDSRFGGFMAQGFDGPAGIALTLFTNPGYTLFHILGDPGRARFLAQILGPAVFLPLLAPVAAWLAAVPALAIQLITDAPTQYNIAYHYSAHLLPLIYFLAAMGAGELVRRRDGTSRRAWPVVLAVALPVASLAVSIAFGQVITPRGITIPRPTAHDRVVQRFITAVPRGASVSAMGAFVPHLSSRRDVYLFPVVGDAEYLLLDTSFETNYWPHEGAKARERAIRDMLPPVRGGQYGMLDSQDGVYLFRRGYDTARNGEALRGFFTARFEAETLPSDLPGDPVSDSNASGGLARRAPDGAGSGLAMAFGPYTDLPPGTYQIDFALKLEPGSPRGKVVTVDVFTHRDGYPRAVRELSTMDFVAPGAYQTFGLTLDIGEQLEDLEFRVLYADVGTVSFDYVEVVPVELRLP